MSSANTSGAGTVARCLALARGWLATDVTVHSVTPSRETSCPLHSRQQETQVSHAEECRPPFVSDGIAAYLAPPGERRAVLIAVDTRGKGAAILLERQLRLLGRSFFRRPLVKQQYGGFVTGLNRPANSTFTRGYSRRSLSKASSTSRKSRSWLLEPLKYAMVTYLSFLLSFFKNALEASRIKLEFSAFFINLTSG